MTSLCSMTAACSSFTAMKQRAQCRQSKDRTEFNRSAKNRDGLHSYCRDCQKAHYRMNAARHGANVRRTTTARLSRMREILVMTMVTGCVDCGNTNIRVLEFDHVRGDKIESIGQMVRRGRAISLIKSEISKCEVRCRNCHAIATMTRLGRSWHDEFLPDNGPPGGI